jgi:hypothetical protein
VNFSGSLTRTPHFRFRPSLSFSLALTHAHAHIGRLACARSLARTQRRRRRQQVSRRRRSGDAQTARSVRATTATARNHAARLSVRLSVCPSVCVVGLRPSRRRRRVANIDIELWWLRRQRRPIALDGVKSERDCFAKARWRKKRAAAAFGRDGRRRRRGKEARAGRRRNGKAFAH